MSEIHNQSILPVMNNMIPNILPVLPVYIRPIFPGNMVPVTIFEEQVASELVKDLKTGAFISFFLVKREYNNISMNELNEKMLYRIGSVGRVVRKIHLPNGALTLMVNCFNRVEVQKFIQTSPYTLIEIKHVIEKEHKEDPEYKALLSWLVEKVEYISKTNPFLTEQVKVAIQNSDSYSRAADFIISIMEDIDKEKLQDILETYSIRKRLEKIAILLEEKLSIVKLQEELIQQINQKTEKQQKEFFLREQMKAIQEELGINTDPKYQEVNRIKKKLDEIQGYLPLEAKETLLDQMNKLENMDSRSPEYTSLSTYMNTAVLLPWKNATQKNINLQTASKILNNRHYGLEDIKNRILEFLAVHKLKKNTKGTILCLVGPPGVGKTSLGKSIAETLQRPFFRFSVGGMRDEAEIKGHRRTYIGAMPGKIIQGLKILQVKNPVFMIDEIDKMSISYQGDPASALLEVLDPEQNVTFRDHYLDLPFDISEILFITTANTLSTIQPALLDRMEVIQLSGYIPEEKYLIGKHYIIGKQQLEHGLNKEDFSLTKKAYIYIAEKYSREAGIRNFEKQIAKLCRKIAYRKIQNISFPQRIDAGDLSDFLGPEIFGQNERKRIHVPGISIGLAWTALGGDTLYIESLLVPSQSSGFKLTGQLGNVMQESAEIAYNYVRSIGKKHKLPLDKLKNNFLHLHVPAGAVPKDGPSAGITMAVSIYSLLLGKKMPQHFAMTGELTLTGNVLAIGGLKEKSIAAVRAGITNIIIPADNMKDLPEIPDIVKKHLTYHPVHVLDDVLKLLFHE